MKAKHTASAAGPPPGRSEAALEAPPSAFEAALEAWVECRPDGLVLSEASLPEVLPVIASHAASCWPAGADPQASAMLFSARNPGEAPLFQDMLKAREGRVQFLHFWRAFSKASQLLGESSGGRAAPNEGLALELETLRDGIMRLLDAPSKGAAGDAVILHSPKLIEALHVASAMSQNPDYWRATEASLASLPPDCDLSWDDVTIMMLQWLRCAIAWQKEPDTYQEQPAVQEANRKGLPVLLNIYDVSQEDSIHKLNKWLAHKNSPLKFGGVFHAGVEVNGLEWSFGMSLSETMPGVSCCEPREHPAHRFRQTVHLRNTRMTPEDISDLISQLLEEYPGDDYDLLRRNCCHFADDFARRLGAGKIPRWVHRLARFGARMDSLVQAVAGRKLLPGMALEESDYEDDD